MFPMKMPVVGQSGGNMGTCTKCGEEKDPEEFYRTLRTICKPCHLAYQRRHYAANQDKYRARDVAVPYARKAARGKVDWALRRGLLQRQPCWVCGEAAQAHHASYAPDMWLAVTWLCPTHHKEAHAKAA